MIGVAEESQIIDTELLFDADGVVVAEIELVLACRAVAINAVAESPRELPP